MNATIIDKAFVTEVVFKAICETEDWIYVALFLCINRNTIPKGGKFKFKNKLLFCIYCLTLFCNRLSCQ